MNRWLKWGLIALVALGLATGLLRVLSARKAQQQAVANLASQHVQAAVVLGSTDVVQVKTRELMQGIEIAGTLKAVNTALVKARVAGELQGLSLREGDPVKAGQVLARIDALEYQARLRQAQQQAQAARAQVDIARRSFENNRSLVEQGFISRTALDTSAANLAAAEASHQAAQAGADIAAKALTDTELRAPLTGVVSQRLAQSGERVAVDARILEILDLGRLELEASLSAGESLNLRLGQVAMLRIEGSDQAVRARVVRINPSVATTNRAVLAYLALDAHAGLRQGLFAQGTLDTGRIQALSVPLSSVRTDKPQPYVQVLNQQKVRHQTVSVGARGEVDGQTMVAVTGLAENTTVIAGSVGTLREGSAVTLSADAR